MWIVATKAPGCAVPWAIARATHVHIRKDTHRRKDGSTRTRVSVAQNVRVEDGEGGSVAKPIEILPLGRLEDLDDGSIDQVIAALERFRAKRRAELAEAGQSESRAAEAGSVAAQVRQAAPTIRLLASKQLGLRMIVEDAWRDLGLHTVLADIEKRRCRTLSLERVVFAMVLNRLVDPTSKRGCVDWVEDHAYLPEGANWKVDDFYAAMDILQRHREEILAHVGRAMLARAKPEDREVLLIDTTTTFSECDVDDDVVAELHRAWQAFDRKQGPKPEDPRPQVVNNPSFRMRGHSKDHRADAPQIVIGVAATGGGDPVWQETYAGNTSDKAVTYDLVSRVHKEFPTKKLLVAMDAGMASASALAKLAALGPEVGWIAGCPVRNNPAVDAILMQQASWPTMSKGHGDTWEVCSHPMPMSAWATPDQAERHVLVRSAERRRRDERKLANELEEVTSILRRDASAIVNGRPSKALTKPGYKRLVREAGGVLSLDETAVALERARCGVKVLRTTAVTGDAGEVLRQYDLLLKLEDRFKDFKHPIAIRPMHHRATPRIQAHALICMLAVMCLRNIEQRTGQTWERVAKTMSTIDAVRMARGPDTWWQRSAMSPAAEAILVAMDLRAGPERWASTEAALTFRAMAPE